MARIDQEIYNKLKTDNWTYQEVAEEVGINPYKFENLMVERFENPEETKEGKTYHLTYTLEWAERVKSGDHFMAADSETEQVLRDAGYEEPLIRH